MKSWRDYWLFMFFSDKGPILKMLDVQYVYIRNKLYNFGTDSQQAHSQQAHELSWYRS